MEYKYKVEVNGMWVEASAFLEPAATEPSMWQVDGLALADDGTLQVTPAVADEKELRDKGMNWNREYTFEIHANGNYYMANQDSGERIAKLVDGQWQRLTGTSQAELQERFGTMLAGFDHIDGTDSKISGDTFGIDSLREHLFVGLFLKVTDNWMVFTTHHDNLGVVQEAVVEAVGLEGDQIILTKVAIADLNFSGTRIYAKGSSGLFATGGYDLLSKMTPGTAIIANIDIDGMSRVIPDRKDIVRSDLYDYCTSQY